MVEKKRQRHLFEDFEHTTTKILLADLSPLCQVIKESGSLVVFFDDIKGMAECSQNLKKSLEQEGKDRLITTIHYHQLLLTRPSQPCVTIVEHFHDFDEKQIAQVLERMGQALDSIIWVILVPTWRPSFKLSSKLREWIQANNLPQFHLEVPVGK